VTERERLKTERERNKAEKERLAREQAERERLERMRELNLHIEPPDNLTEEERQAWDHIYQILLSGTTYRKTMADAELIRQYMQVKLMRDRAWVEWNKKPERYIRIVTGLCADGTTPKVMVKENEHYVILKDCNRQLEKLLADFKLTPKARLY
jgi:phage terminase small subunit